MYLQNPFPAFNLVSVLESISSSQINVDILRHMKECLAFILQFRLVKEQCIFYNTIAHFYYEVSLLMVVENYWLADNDLSLHLHFWNLFHEFAPIIRSYLKIRLLLNPYYKFRHLLSVPIYIAFIVFTKYGHEQWLLISTLFWVLLDTWVFSNELHSILDEMVIFLTVLIKKLKDSRISVLHTNRCLYLLGLSKTTIISHLIVLKVHILYRNPLRK